MPYAKNRRYYSSRRFNKSRRKVAYRPRRPMRPRKPRVSRPMGRLINGFPETYTCKLRYHRLISLNPGVDAPDTWIFLANGLFDPDEVMGAAAGKHQPYQWDQLISQYVRATVRGSKCSVRYLPSNSTATNPPSYVQVTCSKTQYAVGTFAGAGSVPDYSHWREAVAGKKIQMGLQNFQYKQEGGAVSVAKYSPRTIFKCSSKSLLSDFGHANDITQNPPTENWVYFNVVAMAPDSGTDPAGLQLEALIEYTVTFTGKKIMQLS